ncbi:methyltransferase domain-containing protein [bacterium]|nr:methyltransferase domain-containing protein [bacterium]
MRAGSALLSAETLLDIAQLEEGHAVLDVGPGRTGHILFPAAQRVGGKGRVIGVDVSRDTLEMLEGLRRQYLVHQVDFLWMDVEGEHDLPVSDIDAVFVVNTTWMFKRHAGVFSRLAKSLGKKGKIIVVDWMPEGRHALAPRWDFRIDPRRLDVVLAHIGLRAIERVEVTPWHWVRVYQQF